MIDKFCALSDTSIYSSDTLNRPSDTSTDV